MTDKVEELDLYLVWGILGAISAIVYRRSKANNNKNIIISFRGININDSKSHYYSIVDLILSMSSWNDLVRKDFSYQNKNNILSFFTRKLKINSSNAYIKNIIINRFISHKLQKKHKKINLISSCNVPFARHYYGGSYAKYIQIEHGSPIYRTLLSGECKSFSKSRLSLLKQIKSYLNFSRVPQDEEIFTIYSHLRADNDQKAINHIYYGLISEFFDQYAKKYPNEFLELLAIKNKIKGEKTVILGPNSVGSYDEAMLFYENIVGLMGDKGLIFGLNKPHPDDQYNYQESSATNESIINFKFSINKNLPVEFLTYFFDCYGYIGAPTISAIYLSRIFNKSVTILNPANNKKENKFEFGSIHDFLSKNNNFEIIEQ